MKKEILLVVLLINIVFFHTANAQTTAFTFQGQLQNAGNPASGSYDFEFLLFDALSGGTQIGATAAINGVTVTNGIFSVKLDFGDQFPGATRFLEIRVSQTGQGGITTLAPRQPINSAPYGVKALNAENAINATNATNAINATNATNATTANNSLNLGGVAANQYVVTGDGRADAAVFRPSNATWFVQGSTSGVLIQQFGLSSDMPVPNSFVR